MQGKAKQGEGAPAIPRLCSRNRAPVGQQHQDGPSTSAPGRAAGAYQDQDKCVK